MFKITDIRKQRAKHEQQRARLRRIFFWGGGAGVLLTLVFIFVVPPVLRSQLEKGLAKALDRKVTLESARFNPLRASAVLQGLHIQDKDGEELLGWGRLYVNANLWSLLWGKLEFDEIALSGFSGRILVMEDGRLSISDLLAQPGSKSSKDKAAQGPSFKVARLELEGSKFSYEDRSRGENFVTHLGPLNIKLHDFEIHPDNHAPYEFTAVTEAGGRITWRGRVGVSPFRSSGEFELSGIVLRKYAPYYRSFVNFDLLEGKLALQGKYEIATNEDGIRLKFSSGKLGLTGLSLAKQGTKQAVLGFSELSVDGIDLDTSSSKAELGDCTLKGLQLVAVRGKDGRLDLEALLSSKPTAPAAAPISSQATEVSNAWIQQFRMAKFKLEGAQLDLRDEVPRRPALISVRELGASLTGVSLAKGAEVALEFSAKVAGTAPVSATGLVCLSPLKADLQWRVEDLSLPAFSPYLEDGVRARLVQGKLSTQGKLRFQTADSDESDMSSSAQLELKQVALVDELNGEPLAGLEALSLSGIDFKLKARSLLIDELLIRGPSVSATIGKDGRVNLAGLLRESAAPAASQSNAAGAGTSEPAMALRFGKISIDGGRLSLSDQSVRPEVRFSVRDFSGQINGLDTRENSPAKLALSGNLEGSGKILFEGVLYPFGKQAATDLKFAVDGLNLVAFSAYSGKYAGYGLANGRLNLDVKLELQDRKLTSSNVMTLNHFMFGEAVNSPDATKLPVRLAVALLKDKDGQIRVDLPVAGSLDDPEFKVGRVVWRVVGNLLTKAASSPFSLLGAAFGGGEELSHVEFEPGNDSLTSDAAKKLETLQKALVERPGLGLNLMGNYDLTTDVAALRSQHLDQLVARAVWQARVAANTNAPTVAESPVTQMEREQTLRALYAYNHPVVSSAQPQLGAAKVTPAKAPAVAQAPGFFARVYSFLTGRKAQPVQVASRAKTPESIPAPQGQTPALPSMEIEQIVAVLQSALSIDEADLIGLGLARAQLIERRLKEAGVDGARMSVAAPAAGTARVELQLR